MVALSWFDIKYTNLSKESISEKAEFDKFFSANKISRSSEYIGQSIKKWTSSSTKRESHNLHKRSDKSRFLYLPTSISRGSIPHL